MPINILMIVFIGIEEKFLKFIWKHKRPNCQSNPEQKQTNIQTNQKYQTGITTPDFKSYYRAIGKKAT